MGIFSKSFVASRIAPLYFFLELYHRIKANQLMEWLSPTLPLYRHALYSKPPLWRASSKEWGKPLDLNFQLLGSRFNGHQYCPLSSVLISTGTIKVPSALVLKASLGMMTL